MAVLNAYGITADDIDQKKINAGDSVTAMKDGNLDCIMFYLLPPAAAFMDLVSSMDVRFLSVSPEMQKKICETTPELAAGVLPANSYAGQTEDIASIDLATLVVANENADEDMIYDVVQTIYEHTDEIAAVHASGAAFTPDNPGLFLGVVDYHPGAEKYFREAGIIK